MKNTIKQHLRNQNLNVGDDVWHELLHLSLLFIFVAALDTQNLKSEPGDIVVFHF